MRHILFPLAFLAACGELPQSADDDSAELLAFDAEAPPGQCVAPPRNMVGWWTFDESAGPTAGDIAGAIDNAGAWTNGPVPIIGKVLAGLRFDGSNDLVLAADDPELDFVGTSGGGTTTNDLTIDSWVRIPVGSMTGVRQIVDKRDNITGARGYAMYTYNNRLAFQMADAAVPGTTCGTGPTYPCTNWSSTGTIPNDGRWHLLAVTVSRATGAPTGRFFIDGAAAGTFAPRPGSMDNTSPLSIGARSAALGGGAYLRGDLDELEIFKRALSPAEIGLLYTAGAAGKCKEVCDGVDNDSDLQVDEGYADSDGDGVADCVDPRECVQPPPNMVAWWTGDELYGGVAADTAGGIADDGAWMNGVAPTPGIVDGALHFDGVDDFVDVPSSTDLDFVGSPGARYEDLSIDAWVRLPRGGGQGLQVLLDKRTTVAGSPVGYSLFLNNGVLGFQMADSATPGGGCGVGVGYPCTNWFANAASAIPADGQWHFIAVTVDRPGATGTGKFYVDGFPAGSFTPRQGSMSHTGPLTLGVRSAALGGGSYFGGDLDEVEVFSRALTPLEIVQLYGAAELGKCKDNAEVCNGLDDDWNGVIDDGFPDTDGDGTADCMEIEECDCQDNDGDGQIDEGPIDTDGDGVIDADRCTYGVTFFAAADDNFDAWIDANPSPVVSGGGGWSVPAGVSMLLPAGIHRFSVDAYDVYGAGAGFVGYVQTPWATQPTGYGLWAQTNVLQPAGWQNTFHPTWAGDAPSVNAGNCSFFLPTFYAAPTLAPLYAQGAQWTWQNDCSPQNRHNFFQIEVDVCSEAVGCPTAAIGIPCE